MSKRTHQDELEARIRALADGFRRMPNPSTQFHIHGEPLLPMQVAQRLQAMAESFQSIRDAERARREAEEALAKVLPDYRTFYGHTVDVVLSHFGSDRRKLAEFGLPREGVQLRRRETRERQQRRVVRKQVIDEVLADGELRLQETDTETVSESEGPARREPRKAPGPGAETPPIPMPSLPVEPPASKLPSASGGPVAAKPKRGHRR
jgi:hypothetical protein